MLIINDQTTLNQCCDQLTLKRIISIDTEFYRKSTYYAKLSIIQVKAEKDIFIIDALGNLDLSIFKEVLLNNKILKLFHAPREDFEIFLHLFKQLPKNIFDTQIAAYICGFGKQLSYSSISNKILNIKIDKDYQNSNWLKRPLTQNMIDYAISDVEYLEQIYNILQQIIVKNHLEENYDREIKKLLDINHYITKPENAWKKIKFINKSQNFILRLQILAAFREEKAKQLDVPRQHFITNEDLLKICSNPPLTFKALTRLKIQSKYFINSVYAEQMIDLCNAHSELK